jgi:hypothetical protein
MDVELAQRVANRALSPPWSKVHDLAVRVGDTWKVSRDTWCGLVRMIGVECPPPPD